MSPDQSQFCSDLLASGREGELLTPTSEVHPGSGYGIADSAERTKFQENVAFDPRGHWTTRGDAMAAIKEGGLPMASEAQTLARDARQGAQERFGEDDIAEGQGNAWMHARWSAGMAQRFRGDAARRIGDAHERENLRAGESLADTNMDLFNNYQGRAAQNILPSYDPDALVDALLSEGYLQDRPFQ